MIRTLAAAALIGAATLAAAPASAQMQGVRQMNCPSAPNDRVVVNSTWATVQPGAQGTSQATYFAAIQYVWWATQQQSHPSVGAISVGFTYQGNISNRVSPAPMRISGQSQQTLVVNLGTETFNNPSGSGQLGPHDLPALITITCQPG